MLILLFIIYRFRKKQLIMQKRFFNFADRKFSPLYYSLAYSTADIGSQIYGKNSSPYARRGDTTGTKSPKIAQF
jgi:Na+/proline symporter